MSTTAKLQLDTDGRQFGGKIVIDDRVTISDGVIMATYGGTITIGSGSYVGPYCVLYGHGGLVIGCNTMIAAHTVISPFNHGFERADVPMNQQPLTKKGIVIADDIWIGASCCILDGVRIGKGAIIGAGAVVTRDVGDYSVAIGVPAVAVRSRSNAAPDQLSAMRGE